MKKPCKGQKGPYQEGGCVRILLSGVSWPFNYLKMKATCRINWRTININASSEEKKGKGVSESHQTGFASHALYWTIKPSYWDFIESWFAFGIRLTQSKGVPFSSSSSLPHRQSFHSPQTASRSRQDTLMFIIEQSLPNMVFCRRLLLDMGVRSVKANWRRSGRNPNINRQGTLFILQGDIWAWEVLGSQAPRLYLSRCLHSEAA